MMLNRNFWLVTSITVILISGLSTGIAVVEINNNNNKKNNTKQNTDIQKINDIVSKSTDGAVAGPATVDRGADAPPQPAPDDGVAGAGGAAGGAAAGGAAAGGAAGAGGVAEQFYGNICYYNNACMKYGPPAGGSVQSWDIEKCPTVKDACDGCILPAGGVSDPFPNNFALNDIIKFEQAPNPNPIKVTDGVVDEKRILYFTEDEYDNSTIADALKNTNKRGIVGEDGSLQPIPLSLFTSAKRQIPYRCQKSKKKYFTATNGGLLVADQ